MGKPDVRNLRGSAGNVVYGGTVNPLRYRKGGAGNPPPTGARASALPDRVPVARRDLREAGDKPRWPDEQEPHETGTLRCDPAGSSPAGQGAARGPERGLARRAVTGVVKRRREVTKRRGVSLEIPNDDAFGGAPRGSSGVVDRRRVTGRVAGKPGRFCQSPQGKSRIRGEPATRELDARSVSTDAQGWRGGRRRRNGSRL